MVVHNFQEIEHGFCGNIVFNRFDVLDCEQGETLDRVVTGMYSQIGFYKTAYQFQQLAEYATTRFIKILAHAALEKLREYHISCLRLDQQELDLHHLTKVYDSVGLHDLAKVYNATEIMI